MDKDAFDRMVGGAYSDEDREAMADVAEQVLAERRAGQPITQREMLIRMLVNGLGIEPDEAARQVDAALAADELPPELRAALD